MALLTLLAHAGHGTTPGYSLVHLIVEWPHLPLTLVAVAVTASALALAGQASWRMRETSAAGPVDAH